MTQAEQTPKQPEQPKPPKVPWYKRVLNQAGEAFGNAKWGS